PALLQRTPRPDAGSVPQGLGDGHGGWCRPDERRPLHRARDRGLLGLARNARQRWRAGRTCPRPFLLWARDEDRPLRRRTLLLARRQPVPTRARLDLSRRHGQPDRTRLLRWALQAQAGPRALPARPRRGSNNLPRHLLSAPALPAHRWADLRRG